VNSIFSWFYYYFMDYCISPIFIKRSTIEM